MKALTQEQRETLIQELKALIESYSPLIGVCSATRRDILIYKIALASLTAKPFGYGISDPDGAIYLSEICIDSDGSYVSDEVTALNNGVTELEGGYAVVQLFKIPPVPEIKLPQKNLGWDRDGEIDPWNNCIDEIKRMNGLGE